MGLGQVIKDIDPGSPAEAAGLKTNDLLVAVNGVCVGSLGHDDVVEMIRKGGDRTSLLVVDKETDELYRLVSGAGPCAHALRGAPSRLPTRRARAPLFVSQCCSVHGEPPCPPLWLLLSRAHGVGTGVRCQLMGVRPTATGQVTLLSRPEGARCSDEAALNLGAAVTGESQVTGT